MRLIEEDASLGLGAAQPLDDLVGAVLARALVLAHKGRVPVRVEQCLAV